MILHNGFYGHRSILWRYSGFAGSERPIFGSVIHGWFPTFWEDHYAESRWNDRIPLFVWSQRHRQQMVAKGVRNVIQLGSPFAYLLESEDPPHQVREGTVVLLPHSSGGSRLEVDFGKILQAVEECTPPPWTMVIYYQDYPLAIEVLAGGRPDWRVATFGRRHDPAFLSRLVDCFGRHEMICAPNLSSGFFYGIAVGLRPVLLEASRLTPDFVTGGDGYLEDFALGLVRQTLSSSEIREVASLELGREAVRDPHELSRLLGWSGVKRPVAKILSAAVVMKSGSAAVRGDLHYPYPGAYDESRSESSDSRGARSGRASIGNGSPAALKEIPRIHAVAATFRRPSELKGTLDSVFPTSESGVCSLWVVDNDPERSAEVVASELSKRLESVHYLPMDNNSGPAGAFAAGISAALEVADDADWILLLDDDDPVPEASVPQSLIRRLPADSIDRVAGVALSGKRYQTATMTPAPVTMIEGRHQLVDALDGCNVALYSARVLRSGLNFDPDFFFGFDESEFGLRIRKRGHLLLADNDLYSVHYKTLQGRYDTKRGLVPGKFSLGDTNWRRYYSLRNFLVIARRESGLGVALLHAIVRGILKPLVHLPLHPGLALQHLRLNTSAIRDALAGNMGKKPGFPPV